MKRYSINTNKRYHEEDDMVEDINGEYIRYDEFENFINNNYISIANNTEIVDNTNLDIAIGLCDKKIILQDGIIQCLFNCGDTYMFIPFKDKYIRFKYVADRSWYEIRNTMSTM